FQADRQAYSKLPLDAERPTPILARGIERDHQAFKAAPAITDAEQLQRVDEVRSVRLVLVLQDEAEQPAASGEVALPDIMSGRAGTHRAEYGGDLRLGGKPFGDRQGTLCLAFQPHTH